MSSAALHSKNDSAQDVTQGTVAYQPYVPAQSQMPEFTPRAVLLGLFFSILFGAASVYMALCVGRTIGGSIPIAVLVASLFRGKRKMSILENNLVQTIGSAGGSVAGNVVYTTVAFLFLAGGSAYFHYAQLVTLALFGGILGILLMIPLRRSLIVKEHGHLAYPEGQACADVLIAGETHSDMAKPVFFGAWVAGGYYLLMKLLGLWKETIQLIPSKIQAFYTNATLPIKVAPEYLGIGYLIGHRATLPMMGGGVFAWLVLVPLFSHFPALAAFFKASDVSTTLIDLGQEPLKPGALPTADQIHTVYVKSIAMGAVVGAGLIALLKNFSVITGSFRNLVDTLRNKTKAAPLRTEKELPMGLVVLGALGIITLLALSPHLPGRFPTTVLVSVIVLLCGFFFVTVSSRFVGVVGYTVEPVSAMMFTTAMVTCLIFVALGLTSWAQQLTVVVVGAVVGIAAGISGATSQDLKTGFLVGATPKHQQMGLILGVTVSAFFIVLTLLLIDRSVPGYTHAIGTYIPDGDSVPKYTAPQATLLAMLIKAVLGGKVAWGFVVLGLGISVGLHGVGVTPLSVATGMYLPLATTTAMLMGSLIRWWIGRKQTKAQPQVPAGKDAELRRGALYATGLVAGGALAGMFLGFFGGFFPKAAAWVTVGKAYWAALGPWGNYVGLLFFGGLGVTLYLYGRRDR